MDEQPILVERRTGYRWYGAFARRLLDEEYPSWRRRWAQALD